MANILSNGLMRHTKKRRSKDVKSPHRIREEDSIRQLRHTPNSFLHIP